MDGSSIVGTRSVDYYPNQPAPLPLIVQCSHHCDSRVDQQWMNMISEVPDDAEGDNTSFAILLATQMFRVSWGRIPCSRAIFVTLSSDRRALIFQAPTVSHYKFARERGVASDLLGLANNSHPYRMSLRAAD